MPPKPTRPAVSDRAKKVQAEREKKDRENENIPFSHTDQYARQQATRASSTATGTANPQTQIPASSSSSSSAPRAKTPDNLHPQTHHTAFSSSTSSAAPAAAHSSSQDMYGPPPKPNFLADIGDYMPDPHTRPTGTEAQMEPVQKYMKWFEGHQKEMAEAGKENDKGVPPARPKRKATTEGVRSPSLSPTHSLSKSSSSEAHAGTSKGPSTPRKRQR
jgi:hypothetical protein